MRSMLLIVPLLLAGCTQEGAPRFKDTFAEEVAGLTPGSAQRCISPFGQQNLRVLNSRTIAYGHGNSLYVNRLRAECPGLEPTDAIIIESNGQYCSGDHIQGLDPGLTVPGRTCFLGDWTAYRRP